MEMPERPPPPSLADWEVLRPRSLFRETMVIYGAVGQGIYCVYIQFTQLIPFFMEGVGSRE